ncbi:MAG: hypothetical protein ACM3NV_04320, partial [Syntrophothermus sp.]
MIAAAAAVAPARASSHAGATVTVAWLPASTSVEQLASDGFSPGLLSAGLGKVPAQQTYLDVTQGNRVFDTLYDEPLPPLRGDCPSWWKQVVARAESAPAEIVPGLLSQTLRASGAEVRASGETSCTFSPHAASDGGTGSAKRLSGGGRPDHRPAEIVEVRDSSLAQASSLRRTLGRGDLLIGIARPTGQSEAPLAIGIAGGGFDGNLTSDSTRTDGYVLSTDVAPTVLARLGIDVPSQMSGQPIRSQGAVDAAAIEELGARMAVISGRRGPVIGYSLLVWSVLLGLTFLGGGALARTGVRLVGLSLVFLPLVLMGGAALRPGEGVEAWLTILGAPALAAVTLALFDGYRALAVAAAATVLAVAVDVVVGSPLTSLSLLG